MTQLGPGDFLDDLKLVESLHHGATARVFRAEEPQTDRPVAVKIPFGDILNNPAIYYHFQTEERAAPLLNHPGVVRYLDRDRSRQYLVMDYLAGRELRSMIGRGRPMDQEKAVDLTAQAARALGHIHSRGVIHLDVKPENILVDRRGRAVLIDFGAARILDEPDWLALDLSEPQGTPWYVSPEQLLGRRDLPASDIYSLGLVLYEMLTGELPFERSSSVSGAKARLRREPTPPRRHRPDLDPRLQQIILRCLALEPESRFAGGGEMALSLEGWADMPVTESGRRTSRRHSLGHWLKGLAASAERPRPGTSLPGIPPILGAVVNHDSADLVVETAVRQAVVREAGVTLLAVVEQTEEGWGFDFTRYEREKEGGQFLKRLDRYGRLARSYNVDLNVRILPGDTVRVIVDSAEEIGAGLIVVGPSRRAGLKRMFGGSAANRIIKSAPCPVVVARPLKAPPMPLHAATTNLTPEDLAAVDLNLIDVWAAHLNWAADLTRALARDPEVERNLDPHSCAFGAWLEELKADGAWAELIDILEGPHLEFHRAARRLVGIAGPDTGGDLGRIYRAGVAAASDGLRQAIQAASTALRRRAAVDLAGLNGTAESGEGGPIIKLKAISDYFCDHPDGSPDACLMFITNHRDQTPADDPDDEGGGGEPGRG